MKTVNENLQELTRTYVREGLRLWTLANIEREYGLLARTTRRRLARQEWVASIRDCAEPLAVAGYYGDIPAGTPVVALCKWERDCDCVEGTSMRLVEATVAALDEAVERDYDWAEGPVRHWIQRPSDAFESEFHDRALEAFEDGHAHVIYG